MFLFNEKPTLNSRYFPFKINRLTGYRERIFVTYEPMCFKV